MPEIIKAYRESIGAMRFVGKRYTNSDRGPNGMFGVKWVEWIENGWFDLLRQLITEDFKNSYAEGAAPIGLMCEQENDFDTFEYWIGYFMPENIAVPEGFQYVDFPKSNLGVCWLYGKEDEVFGLEAECLEKLVAEGFEIVTNWCFERYAIPRSEASDEKGNIVIDICFFVK